MLTLGEQCVCEKGLSYRRVNAWLRICCVKSPLVGFCAGLDWISGKCGCLFDGGIDL